MQGQEDMERMCIKFKDDTDELGLHPEWAVFRDV